MPRYRCTICDASVGELPLFPINCRCGARHTCFAELRRTPAQLPNPSRTRAKECYALCATCNYFRDGCTLLTKRSESPLEESDRKPCRIFEHIYDGGGCPADPPLFSPADKAGRDPASKADKESNQSKH